MSQKTYLNILKYGVYLSLIVVFFVFKNLLFPYITSKQISFNIWIEFLFIIWLAFVIKYPEYRPKKSHITFGLAGFFLFMLISSIFGVDFNLSFWGDIERMLGVFHLLHFFAFYLIIITVFKEWKDWKIFLIASIVVANIIAIKGITEISYSTIGNTAYVSGYLIFNMYFTMLLFFRENNKALRWLYLAALPLMFKSFDVASTTGAFVGLGFSMIIVALLYVILSKNRKIQIISLILFLGISSFGWLVLNNRKASWVTGNKYLQQVAEIDINKSTFQTRLISWRAAIKDFKNHPLLGTGHGNYAIIFDKYFDPKFYNYTRGETYFDRAHNNVIDIASTDGALALLAYLFIFAAAAYYLIGSYRRGKIGTHEFIMLAGLFIAYFVQNLAVFDSLVTYISLMMLLAYVYWINISDQEFELPEDRGLNNKEIYTYAISGLIIITIMYQFNIKPLKMLEGTIAGQRAWAQRDVVGTIDAYKKALSYHTPLDRDSITSLNRLFAGGFNSLNSLDPQQQEEIINYNITLAQQNIKYNPHDSLNQMMLAQLANAAATYYANDKEKFSYYSDIALEAINQSIAASPRRIPIYFQKAQILITRGDKDQAIATLQDAINLSDTYYDSYCHMGRTLLYYQEEEKGYGYIDQCLDKGGVGILQPANFVKFLINHYAEAEDWDRTLKLYEGLVKLEPKVTDDWIKLAKLYAQMGDKDKAKDAAMQASKLDPGLQQNVQDFINSL